MLRVALHGINGHQIQNALASCADARLVAISAFPRKQLPPALRSDASICEYPSLDTLLAAPDIDFVSLCSPRRADQAADAIRCLRSGKHVLAEKPCALTEPDLDAIIRASRETHRVFHEMSGTAFAQPYLAMREIARSGILGEIVQIISEKSYPAHLDARPQDEAIDGGLVTQNAIHALRFIEHVACAPIASIRAVETTLGNPRRAARSDGGLRMAASLLLTLKNGGVASLSANYLNPRGTKIWGDESLKILGTRGIVESLAGGARTRLVIDDRDHGPLDTTPPARTWLQTLFAALEGRAIMPLSLEEELSPTRWAIRAKQSATRHPS
jgi:predicted dehydrogenase